ncbi:MAG: hypothetical protein AAGM22_14145 [Acidobacteriota bacterium]
MNTHHPKGEPMPAPSSKESIRDPETGRGPDRDARPLDAEQRAAERLLAELAELERRDAEDGAAEDGAAEDVAVDARWLALCKGELSAAEARALESETPEAERPSLEAFRPLSADFQDDMVRRLEQMRGAATEEPTPLRRRSRPTRRATQSAGRWSRRLSLAAAVLVAIVGAALLSRTELSAPAPLPGYSIEWTGGALDERSSGDSSAGIPRWRPGTELQLQLRPDTTFEGSVYVHAFLVRAEEVRPWPGPPPEVASTGAVRLRAALPLDQAPAPGRWSVLILLSPEPGAAPSGDALRRPEEEQQDPNHRRVVQPVDILERAF